MKVKVENEKNMSEMQIFQLICLDRSQLKTDLCLVTAAQLSNNLEIARKEKELVATIGIYSKECRPTYIQN